jgi:hypothetical protein
MRGENGSVGFLQPDQCRYVEAMAAAAWGVEPERFRDMPFDRESVCHPALPLCLINQCLRSLRNCRLRSLWHWSRL